MLFSLTSLDCWQYPSVSNAVWFTFSVWPFWGGWVRIFVWDILCKTQILDHILFKLFLFCWQAFLLSLTFRFEILSPLKPLNKLSLALVVFPTQETSVITFSGLQENVIVGLFFFFCIGHFCTVQKNLSSNSLSVLGK